MTAADRDARSGGAGVAGAVEKFVGESFREFALRFRHDIGRPMTEEEWALAQLAHTFGYTDGSENALRDLEVMEEAAQTAATDEGGLDA